LFNKPFWGDIIVKNVDVIEAGVAPEMLDNYVRDLGLEQQDYVFIK